MGVTAATVPLNFQYAARIAAFRQTQVRARVGGILQKRDFVEGSEVKAGDPLFTIDPAMYEAALAQATAQLKQAEAQLSQARREEKRALSLFSQNVTSERARDDAISARELAEAAVAAAQAQIVTATLNLRYTKVVAPIGGFTSLENLPEGSLVNQSDLLASITQLDPVYVNFSFSDAQAAELRRLSRSEATGGQERKLSVRVSFGDGSAYDHEGLVDFTSSTIDPQTGTLQARAVIDNPDHRLIPGQFVRATISGISVDNAIVVPEIALIQNQNGQSVYTIDDNGNARANPVTLGHKVGDGWVVLSGLNAGDRVITEGVIRVRPGAPVNVIEQSAQAKTAPVPTP